MRKLSRMSDMKNKGVDKLFLISLRGVFIIKQLQPLGGFNIDINSLYRSGCDIISTRSIGFLLLLSTASLEAPLINNDLTGLVLLSYSTLLTARCNGVYPSMSLSSKVGTQLNK